MARHTSGRQLTTLCMFYEQGWCKAGDRCRFTHGKSDRRKLQGDGKEGPSGAAATIAEECKFFAKGRCSRGQKCPFLHSRYSADEDHRRKTQAPPSSPPKRPKRPNRSRRDAAATRIDQSQARRSPQRRRSAPRPPSPHPGGFYVRERDSGDESDVVSTEGSCAPEDDAGPILGYALGVYSADADEGVYFYGAPGGFDESSGTRRRPAAGRVEDTISTCSWLSAVRGGSPGHTPRPIAARSPSPDAPGASASRSLESPGAPAARTCTFYLRGTCRFGERCKFSHDAEPWTAEETKGELEVREAVEWVEGKTGADVIESEHFKALCRWVRAGKDDGNEGKEEQEEDEAWLEAKEEEELEAAKEASLDEEERVQSRDAECGVCLEKVKGKFGILVGCKHVYCLSCIREWRTKSNNRDCPQCRVTSYFVVPSVKLVTDPERKERLMAHYRKALHGIPCQHFDYGASECPFGNSCFYSHRRRDGTEEDRSTPRLRLTESGETERVRGVHLSSFFDRDF